MKDSRVEVRMNPAEKAAWQVAADKAGLSLSAWLRAVAISAAQGEPPTAKPVPRPSPKPTEPPRGGRFDLPGRPPNANPERDARIRGVPFIPDLDLSPEPEIPF
jgi:hypothetical protein